MVTSPQNIIDSSASSLAAQIRNKQLTSEQVVQAFLARIAEVNPKINAIVELNPHALDQAKELDKYLQETGNVKGLLHGVPITVKEQLAVIGFKQTQGGVLALKDHRATFDSSVIAKLKAAGAVILGTTNSPEMAMAFETTNHMYGTTNNAVDQSRSAGGSSGGEGAIVAARGSPLGIGTDIGGSIRVPAHCNGVHGLKPSKGRVPMTKCYYLGEELHFESLAISAELACVGPLSRFVEDLELALKVISGPDYVDSWCVAPAYSSDFHKVEVNKLRAAYFYEIPGVPVTNSTRAAVEKAVSLLKQNGAQITEAVPPLLEKGMSLWVRLMGRMGNDNSMALSTAAGGKPTKQLQWLVEYTEPHKIQHPMQLEGLMIEWKNTNNANWSFMANFDVIISPVMPTPALPHDKSNEFIQLSYNTPWNVAGYPAAVVGNMGTGTDDFAGLPIGVQVIAAPFREDIVLAAANLLQSSN